MSRPTYLELLGLFRPRLTPPGFGIPVFGTLSRPYVQVAKDGRIQRFVSCDVQAKHIRRCFTLLSDRGRGVHSGAIRDLFFVDVGSPPLCGFQDPNGWSSIGEQSYIAAFLRRRADALENFPFVLCDVADFLGDKSLLEKATRLAGTKFAIHADLAKEPAPQLAWKSSEITLDQLRSGHLWLPKAGTDAKRVIHKGISIKSSGTSRSAQQSRLLQLAIFDRLKQGEATPSQILTRLGKAGYPTTLHNLTSSLRSLIAIPAVDFRPLKTGQPQYSQHRYLLSRTGAKRSLKHQSVTFKLSD